MCSLVLSYFQTSTFDDLSPVLLMYGYCLLNDPALSQDEVNDYLVRMWRSRWSSQPKSSLRKIVLDTFDQYSQDYPVAKKLLLCHFFFRLLLLNEVLLHLNIKSYRRSTVGEERLNEPAKLCIYRRLTNGHPIDNFVLTLTDIFPKKKREANFIV